MGRAASVLGEALSLTTLGISVVQFPQPSSGESCYFRPKIHPYHINQIRVFTNRVIRADDFGWCHSGIASLPQNHPL